MHAWMLKFVTYNLTDITNITGITNETRESNIYYKHKTIIEMTPIIGRVIFLGLNFVFFLVIKFKFLRNFNSQFFNLVGVATS